MTLKEFLQLPKEEQAIEAAKVFTPKPWKHKFRVPKTAIESCRISRRCVKCDEVVVVSEDSPCSVPDPIKIDWNNAKRLQGECFEASVYDAIKEIFLLELGAVTYGIWITCYCKPIHYIAACMAAKGYFK